MPREAFDEQLKELEQDLLNTEQKRRQEISMNKYEINQLQDVVVDLRERINQFIALKNEREKRIEELERKIKEKVGKNYNELIKLEKLLNSMEEKYKTVKEKGGHDKGLLQNLEDKIRLVKK